MTVESHAIRQARRLLTYIVEENGTLVKWNSHLARFFDAEREILESS
jgi:hypothetical protein